MIFKLLGMTGCNKTRNFQLQHPSEMDYGVQLCCPHCSSSR